MAPFTFSACGIAIGEQIEFYCNGNDHSGELCEVVDDKHVSYNGETGSLTALAKHLTGVKSAKLDHDAAMAAFSQFINDQSLLLLFRNEKRRPKGVPFHSLNTLFVFLNTYNRNFVLPPTCVAMVYWNC